MKNFTKLHWLIILLPIYLIFIAITIVSSYFWIGGGFISIGGHISINKIKEIIVIFLSLNLLIFLNFFYECLIAKIIISLKNNRPLKSFSILEYKRLVSCFLLFSITIVTFFSVLGYKELTDFFMHW